MQRLIDQVRAELAHRERPAAAPSASVTIDRSVVVGTNTSGLSNVNTSGGDYAEGEIRK